MEQREEGQFLTKIRQLSFAGRRTGEGYFSADGRQLVFQSEREPGNPFYQIYHADLESGETRRVSPGIGKTTCGWIHPRDGRVLFSSTHHDPSSRAQQTAELEKRASGEASRYSWDYDPEYELYVSTPGSDALVRLAPAYGYDAEASISPDGEWVVFTSNRHAYAGPGQVLENPSVEMDLYRVRMDGTDLQRLTEAAGYDGGAFFSADGSQIVWRRFAPDGHLSEIFSMPSAGGDARQLTQTGLISWAPYFHPSGEYVIYAAHAAQAGEEPDWNLFLVDREGRETPVQVTEREGFDGLPVFSPAGDELLWSRASRNGTQLFRASWNHSEALRALGVSKTAGASRWAAGESARGRETADPLEGLEALTDHITTLASEAMGGRETGTPGEQLATQYAADFFAAQGLEPAGDDGSFFQRFEFTAGVDLEQGNRLSAIRDGVSLPIELGTAWRPLALSSQGTVAAEDVVFAGYGIVAPEHGEQPAYDSYGDSSVDGKWLAVLRFAPEDVSPERRQHLNRYAGYRYKAMLARERGAVGILLMAGPRTKLKDELIPLRADASLAGSQLAAVSLSASGSVALFERAGFDLDVLQKRLDKGAVLEPESLDGVQVEAEIALRFQTGTGRNVLARLPGTSDAPPLIVGAHIDHLGRGTSGSLAKRKERGEIHIGADDNASGVGGLLHVAERLVARRAPLTRDVLFAAWSGEELGLIGSGHFARQLLPDNPHASHSPDAERPVAAYLNMDMIGRLEGSLLVSGVGSSSVWNPLVEAANLRIDLPLEIQADAYLPTDSTSFYVRGIPVLSAFTGVHGEYHTPRDTPDRLNLEGTLRVAELITELAAGIASDADMPDFVAMKAPAEGARGGLRVYLGTVPDYSQGQLAGVALQGVVPGGPADKAGLRSGDVIIELAGQAIENIYELTYAMGRLSVGDQTEIVVTRAGERLELQVTPESRQ